MPTTTPPDPWTKGYIPTRKGNCNIILVAPHGHPKDDTNTGKLTRRLADNLNCYAVINEKYQKPETADVLKADPNNFIADLYKKEDVNLKELKPLFLNKIRRIKRDILNNYNSIFIIYVHGIATVNTPKVAKLIPEFKKRTRKLQAIIGYGQWENDKSKPTADLQITIKPLIKKLIAEGLETAIAPTKPIKVDGKNTWYCGWDDDRLNQYLYDSKVPMQSLQLELKEAGVRKTQADRNKNANFLAAAIRRFLDSAVQKNSFQQIRAGEIDMDNKQFMSRVDDIASGSMNFIKLVDSIKKNGILNNVVVRKINKTDGKHYQLISGFRRMTALRAAITEKDGFENTIVPAKILDEIVSDDEAYQISFAENLARQDLSLWEIAVACAKIKEQKQTESKVKKGEVEAHLAALIQKDARTVRRYLRLAYITNIDIVTAVHTGEISPTTALDMGKKDLDEDEISALLEHLKRFPKSTRSFVRFYNNLEMCSNRAGMTIAEVLVCSNADRFLMLEEKELIERIEYRRKISDKSVSEVLKGEAGSLIKAVTAMDVELTNKSLHAQFEKASKPLFNTIRKALEKSEIDADFKIKPGLKSKNGKVMVIISAPVDQIPAAMNLASTEISKKVKTLGSQVQKVRKRAKQKKVLKSYTEAEWGGAIASMGRLVDIRNFPDAAVNVLLGNQEAFLGMGYKEETKALNPDFIGALVFWTKGPADLLVDHPGLRQVLEVYHQKRAIIGLQLSVTGFGGTFLEPGIQSPEEIAAGLKKVLDTGLILPEAIQLRYDPLMAVKVPGDRLLRNDTPEAFEKVVPLFSDLGVKTVETKFLLFGKKDDGQYFHVWKRMQEAGVTPLPIHDHQKMFSGLGKVYLFRGSASDWRPPITNGKYS